MIRSPQYVHATGSGSNRGDDQNDRDHDQKFD
jgi:hypothetical protein